MSMLITITSLLIADNSLFDGLQLPKGIDKDTVVDNIVMECGELEVLFADPSFMKQAITSWSKSIVNVWERLNETYSLDTDNPWDVNTDIYSENGMTNGVDQRNSTSKTSGSDRTLQTVAGFNSEVMVDKQADTINYGATVTGEDSTTVRHNTEKSGTHEITMKRDSADVIRKVRENRKFNIYDVIVTDFKERFCLLVY